MNRVPARRALTRRVRSWFANRCPYDRKRIFPDLRAAWFEAGRVCGETMCPMEAYSCTHCGYFHITTVKRGEKGYLEYEPTTYVAGPGTPQTIGNVARGDMARLRMLVEDQPTGPGRTNDS